MNGTRKGNIKSLMTSLKYTKLQTDARYDDMLKPRAQGYLGADGALSIALSENRIAWFFGDTLLGRIEGGRREFHSMPNNSIGIQRLSEAGAEAFDFYWGSDEDENAAFFRPEDGKPHHWIWVTAGALVRDELMLFGYQVCEKPGPCEALSFDLEGMIMIRIANPHEDPHQWRPVIGDFSIPSSARHFCSSCYVEAPYLYLLGCDNLSLDAPQESWAILARIGLDALCGGHYEDSIEFWSKQAGGAGWSREAGDFAPLFRPGVSETTLHYDKRSGHYLCPVYDTGEHTIMMTAARELTGPWSPPVVIHRVRGLADELDVLCYATRLHPELATAEGECVLTYLLNGRQIELVRKYPEIYYPRFMRFTVQSETLASREEGSLP